jgi:hypothetical protein
MRSFAIAARTCSTPITPPQCIAVDPHAHAPATISRWLDEGRKQRARNAQPERESAIVRLVPRHVAVASPDDSNAAA